MHFQIAGEALDIRAARAEQPYVVLLAARTSLSPLQISDGVIRDLLVTCRVVGM
jgi:hypothetical protein